GAYACLLSEAPEQAHGTILRWCIHEVSAIPGRSGGSAEIGCSAGRNGSSTGNREARGGGAVGVADVGGRVYPVVRVAHVDAVVFIRSQHHGCAAYAGVVDVVGGPKKWVVTRSRHGVVMALAVAHRAGDSCPLLRPIDGVDTILLELPRQN